MTKAKNNRPDEISAPPALDVMAEFDRLREVLGETHRAIPRLLQQQREADRALGSNDTEALRRELERIVSERQHWARQRSAAVASILELEPALQAERAAAERDRASYAIACAAAFEERYARAVSELQALWREGEALARALRCTVAMPVPAKVKASVIDGSPQVIPAQASGEVAVSDVRALELGAKLDRVDQALAACHAVRTARELDARHYRLSTDRGTPSEFLGTFRVTRTFMSQIDALEFAAGDLIDGTLVGHGMLHRLQVARSIEPVGLAGAAA
jgi:hypothetical protein